MLSGYPACLHLTPLHEFELRHNRLLIAVADHVAGCNAGWSAAMMLSRGVPGVVFREANP